jgi:uncharacterized membrane protein YczE
MVRENWIILLNKFPSFFFGLFLFAVGIVTNLNAGLGTLPWIVLSVSITNHTPLTLGQVTQLISLLVLIIGWILGFPPGFGTLANMYFVGLFIDLLETWRLIPLPINLLERFLMLLISIILLGLGTLFHIRVQLGAGPRDGLMLGIVRVLDRPVFLIRGSLEITVCVLGYLLGGPVGIGTLITALTIGYSIQAAFKLGRFDPRSHQMDIYQLLKFLVNK